MIRRVAVIACAAILVIGLPTPVGLSDATRAGSMIFNDSFVDVSRVTDQRP